MRQARAHHGQELRHRQFIAGHTPDIANNGLLKFLKRGTRMTDGLCGNSFWVRDTDTDTDTVTGRLERFAKPLWLAPVLAFIGRKIVLLASSARLRRRSR